MSNCFCSLVASGKAAGVKWDVSTPAGNDPFFGVYDRKGTCVAVGKSSDQAVETAWKGLGLSTAQEVMNQHSVAQIERAFYEKFLQS